MRARESGIQQGLSGVRAAQTARAMERQERRGPRLRDGTRGRGRGRAEGGPRS